MEQGAKTAATTLLMRACRESGLPTDGTLAWRRSEVQRPWPRLSSED